MITTLKSQKLSFVETLADFWENHYKEYRQYFRQNLDFKRLISMYTFADYQAAMLLLGLVTHIC